MANTQKKSGGMKPDFATIAGVVIALGGIIAGLLLEGGKIKDISQFTAALIVIAGTAGAVMITTPLPVLIGAAARVLDVLFDREEPAEALATQILDFAAKARKEGIVSLESVAEEASNPFLRKALMLAVDGTNLHDLRNTMELEIMADEGRREAEAKVYETAGGYAPTIGIIGAVLGLIQVMKHLENIEEVGRGIAVAFVANCLWGCPGKHLLPACRQ